MRGRRALFVLTRSLALTGLLGVLATAAVARADGPKLTGSLVGHFLETDDGAPGGAAMLDVGVPIGVLRLGAGVGLAVLGGSDERTRVMMPFAASGALDFPLSDAVVLSWRLRGGAWAGATDNGLQGGGFVSSGVHALFGIGHGVSVSVGLDGWLLLGQGDMVVIAPGLGLAWAPDEDEENEPVPADAEPDVAQDGATAGTGDATLDSAPAADAPAAPAPATSAAEVAPSALAEPSAESPAPAVSPAPSSSPAP